MPLPPKHIDAASRDAIADRYLALAERIRDVADGYDAAAAAMRVWDVPAIIAALRRVSVSAQAADAMSEGLRR